MFVRKFCRVNFRCSGTFTHSGDDVDVHLKNSTQRIDDSCLGVSELNSFIYLQYWTLSSIDFKPIIATRCNDTESIGLGRSKHLI